VSDVDEYYDNEDAFYGDENQDPNADAADETREQRHARRVREAMQKLDGEVGKELKVNDTTWKVVREHHRAATADTVRKPELVGLDFEQFSLLKLFRHMYPGVPEEDIERANSFMAQKYGRWMEITAREWFLWHGLCIAATLYGGKVRRAPFATPRMFATPPSTPRRADSARALTSVPSHVTRAGRGAVGHQNQRVGPAAELRTIRHVLPQVPGHLRGRRLLQICEQRGARD